MDLRNVIREIPDFPKPGILFYDITPIMEQPAAFRAAIGELRKLLDGTDVDAIAAIESRGFIFGGPLALDMDKPMALLRKAGKLPGVTYAVTYSLEYGEATLEVHKDAFTAGAKVVIVDDLLATGGTAEASARLVREAGGEVAAFLFVVELGFLGGREKLTSHAPVFSLVNYDTGT